MGKHLVHCVFFFILFFSFNALKAIEKDGNQYKVKLQLKWKHQFQFAGYYAAIEQGFYKDEGIEVELIEPQLNENTLDAVFDGKADFGIANTDLIIQKSLGQDVVVLASIFQHSPLVLVVSKKSGIKTVHDLIGKKIELEAHAADIITYMKDEGIDLEDCIISNHEFGIDNFLAGEIDAITAYSSDEIYLLQEAGFQYSAFSPIMGGIDFYGDVLFTSKNLVKENISLVEKFRNASLKGWEYAFENKDEVIELIYTKYSQRHSKGHLYYEASKMEHMVLPNVVELGYSNKGRWSQIINIYYDLGLIKRKISVDGLLLKDYIKTNSDFNWRLFLFYIGSFLLVFLIAYTYYRAYKRLKRESQKRLAIQNRLIERERQLLKARKTQDKLYSIIAHDLKSPINVIVGFTDLLLKNWSDYDQVQIQEDLERINSASHRTIDLLKNLLYWSSSQSLSIEFKPENLNLTKVIRDVIDDLIEVSRNKNITINFDTKNEMLAQADKNMMSVVIRNLLSNAIKFTPNNGNIHLELEDSNTDYKISISDSGVGITKEDLTKLFHIDRSVVRNGTLNEQGSGLGLLLCKEFVEKHGGNIEVQSEPNKGSTFLFSIPKGIGL